MNEPTHLDLFSGIGGFALAAQWAGFRTIGFCEIDKYCQKVLAKNFLADTEKPSNQQHSCSWNGWQDIRRRSPEIIGNIFDLDGRQFYGVSLITGGFPCQPFSVAGKRRGAADDRAIWPQMFRVITEARPAWVLGENVPGIIPMELDNVLSDLEGIGYATRSFVIPACAVDARHRRDRLWVVAKSISDLDQRTERGSNGISGTMEELDRKEHSPTWKSCRASKQVGRQAMHRHEISNTGSTGLEGQRQVSCRTGTQLNDAGDYCRWLPEPDVVFGSNGLSTRLDGGINAATSISRSTEILSGLWERVAPAAIQRTTGGQWRIPAAEVLLTDVHGDRLCQRHIGIICETQAGYKVPWDLLRSVWGYGESGLSSHRRESEQRLAKEHSDLMCLLSYYSPPPCSACWWDNSWEDGMPRVAHGIKNRVDRLKGLGNSIVPQVAYEILREIRKLI